MAALEAGQVVVAYDPSSLPDHEVRETERLVREQLEDRVTVTPFEGDMGAPLVLNAWGARRPCDQFDIDAVRAFVDRFASQTTTDDH